MSPSQPAAQHEQIWQQLSCLKLRLRDTVLVDRLSYRGHDWFVLRNQFNNQQMRVSQSVYQLLSRLNGQRTLAEAAGQLLSDEMNGISQQTLVGVLLQLHLAEMLSSDTPRNLQALVDQGQQRKRQARLSRWFRLLSPRIPLFNPDPFLLRTVDQLGWLFHPLMGLIWLALMLSAGVIAIMHAEALMVYAAQRLNDPTNWLLMVCLYPLIKGLHELAHGYSARRYGAAVNEMGINFLIFIPVPYVDATAATVIRNKYQRMLIGAAGILCEGLLAALALFAWLALDDGLARDMSFMVMLIGGVSTLLFNGNPLLRYDGYHVLADAIEIPNLASRSALYYSYLLKRYVFGLSALKPPLTARGERRWFILYAAASYCYRLSIGIGIAVFLINSVPTLGYLLAAWLLGTQFLLPLARQLNFLARDPSLGGRRRAAWLRLGALQVVLLAIITLLPFPQHTKVNGIVLMPEDGIIRATNSGFLQRQYVSDNTPVSQGEVLFDLADSELDATLAELQARISELSYRLDALGFDAPLDRDIHKQRLNEAQIELKTLEQRRAELRLLSPVDGILRTSVQPDHLGRFIRQGDLLAYVSNSANGRIRVVADQQDAAKIRAEVNNIGVYFTDPSIQRLTASELAEVPAGSETLPSAALGSQGGGQIQVDARDSSGLRALQAVYTFDITVAYDPAVDFIGRRALIRFEHAPAPLFAGIKDGLRRFVLEKIGE